MIQWINLARGQAVGREIQDTRYKAQETSRDARPGVSKAKGKRKPSRASLP